MSPVGHRFLSDSPAEGGERAFRTVPRKMALPIVGDKTLVNVSEAPRSSPRRFC